MTYKHLKHARQSIASLNRDILAMTHEIEDADDLHGAVELFEICASIVDGLKRLQEFDIRVAERRLSNLYAIDGGKKIDKSAVVR